MTTRGQASHPVSTDGSTGRSGAAAAAVSTSLVLTLALQSAVPPFATVVCALAPAVHSVAIAAAATRVFHACMFIVHAPDDPTGRGATQQACQAPDRAPRAELHPHERQRVGVTHARETLNRDS